ncbi:tigger transposable element-derived protein 6-like [Ornithodoros turicata]|uniref:tigger transposable element-derived protein 6-like n=1 Tax=Ornithodoros turicata TaxID=34597 RepID=UPI0031396321
MQSTKASYRSWSYPRSTLSIYVRNRRTIEEAYEAEAFASSACDREVVESHGVLRTFAPFLQNTHPTRRRELFKWWLTKLDKKFELQKRRVLLIVDNCSAQKVDVELESIELAFLPANKTAALQPMDQGIFTKNVKSFYRRHILERTILCAGNYSVNLLSAMHMLARAQHQVTVATISNCFRHCGFVVADTEASDSAAALEVACEDISDVLHDVNFSDYINADSGVAVCGALTDEDIICEVVSSENAPTDICDDDDEGEEEDPQVCPSASQVIEALNVARLFFSCEENEEGSLCHVYALERSLSAIEFKKKQQRMIADFFSK